MPGAGRNAGAAGLTASPAFETPERVDHLLNAEVADHDHSQPPVAKLLGPVSDQLVTHAKHRLRRPKSRKAVWRIGQRQGQGALDGISKHVIPLPRCIARL